jgi:hypothetical protein
VITSSSVQSTPREIIVDVNLQVRHTINNVPGQHVTVSQCCPEVDSSERWYEGSPGHGLICFMYTCMYKGKVVPVVN